MRIPDFFGFLRRNKAPTATRRFEGAGGGRRFAGLLPFGNTTNATLAANPTLRGRQRTQASNNVWLSNAVAALKAATVGAGIKPQSMHPNTEIRAKLQAMWARWTDRADIEGRNDFYGFMARLWGTTVMDGESFVRLETVDRDLQLRHIPAEQIDSGYTFSAPNGGRIIGGVEFDANGVRTAYHVFRDPPGAPFPGSMAFERSRVPASDLLHIFDVMWPGQVRGVSPLSTVLLRLHELDQLEDAQLVRIKLGAMLAGFIRDSDGSSTGFSGDQKPNGILESGLEPGTLKVLPPGTEVSFSAPVEPGNVTEWIKLQLHGIAAGIGVTYEQLTGDLSGVNYSSIRAGLVEFRRRIEMQQHNVVVFQFCRPVWRRLVLFAMLRGELPDDGRPETFDAYCNVNWIPPGWDWVDPQKDAQADALAIAAGLKSRREVVASKGYDVEQLDAEIASDRAREKLLGLNFTAPPPVEKPARETL